MSWGGDGDGKEWGKRGKGEKREWEIGNGTRRFEEGGVGMALVGGNEAFGVDGRYDKYPRLTSIHHYRSYNH